jgi:hypothetical protein
VPPLALLLFLAQVFVQLAKVILHLAQVALHVLQVIPHLTQALLPLVVIGALLWLSPTITTPGHEISSLPESASNEQVDACNVPDEVLGDIVVACRPWGCRRPDDPPPAQRSMSARAGSTVEEASGSHAIYVSKPAVVADLIRSAVSANV